MKNPYFKLPIARHPKVPYAIVDADGQHVMTCGINGDGDQAGAAIADIVISLFNGQAQPSRGGIIDEVSWMPAPEAQTEDKPAPATRRRTKAETATEE